MLKVASIFSQILGQVSRIDFQKLVVKHGAERHAKGFRSWTQFVAMLFCHLARAESLREICYGLSCCNGKLVHLGVNRLPNKSTLSYANEHSPSELFRDMFWMLMDQFRTSGKLGMPGAKKFRFKNELLLFDSTTISLCLSLFPWADFRRYKGGVKLHVLLEQGDYMPSFVHITEARTHDSKAAHLLSLPEGSIIALLVIKWLHYLSKAGWSLSNMAVMIRLNLFTHRNLKKWLDSPYATPPLMPEPGQTRLAF